VLAGSPSINIHRVFFIDSHSTIYCTQRRAAKLTDSLAGSLQLTFIAGLKYTGRVKSFPHSSGEPQMADKKPKKFLKAGKKIESIKPLSSDRIGIRKLARLARLSRPHSK
jgi:hypothetical protein